MSHAGETPMDLERYSELVDRCARERLDLIIPNSSPVHARLLITKLFATARQTVQIIAGRLTDATDSGENVYGDRSVIAQAAEFLHRPGSKLTIILDNELHLGEQNRFVSGVIRDTARQGEVTLYKDTKIVASNEAPHFMVTDALAYRFEPFTGNSDQISASANFGDPSIAKRLQAVFCEAEDYLRSLKVAPIVFPPSLIRS